MNFEEFKNTLEKIADVLEAEQQDNGTKVVNFDDIAGIIFSNNAIMNSYSVFVSVSIKSGEYTASQTNEIVFMLDKIKNERHFIDCFIEQVSITIKQLLDENKMTSGIFTQFMKKLNKLHDFNEDL